MSRDQDPVIVRVDGVMGGRPIFRGTRVQAEILFENLAAGYSIEDIVDSFPSLDLDDVRMALKQACEKLMKDAPMIEYKSEQDAHAHHA